jgi:hypothetical protein
LFKKSLPTRTAFCTSPSEKLNSGVSYFLNISFFYSSFSELGLINKLWTVVKSSARFEFIILKISGLISSKSLTVSSP